MDEKLQHFLALLNERPRLARPSRARVGARTPLILPKVIALAGSVLLAAAAAAGYWQLRGWPRELMVRAPQLASVDPVPPVTATPTPVPVPVASPEVRAPVNPEPPTPPVGDEASMAPSTVAAAPVGSDADGLAAGVVPPPELASLPPPVIATPERPTGVPPWIRYALAPPQPNGMPRVVLVIDDMGVDRKRSERAVSLAGPLTLSYLPYAKDLPQQTEAAHRAGHELMVHVPMEPFGHVSDAWPDQLEVSLSHDEVLRRLRWDLSRFGGYVGINNHMGSRFTSDAEALRPVIEELRARGLLFLDSRTAPHSFGVPLARELGVPYAGRDVFLDDEITVPAIEAQLGELERVARRNGIAIAIGHPHDPTLEVLGAWLKTLPQKGLQLVPLSAAVRSRPGPTG